MSLPFPLNPPQSFLIHCARCSHHPQIVNGTKKWITNGVFSDYFVVGVNTGKGLSVLLIERGEGVETKPIKTSYSPAAGTAYITFDNVKVPVENLLGKEDKGIHVILSNFNHERWTMVWYVLADSYSSFPTLLAMTPNLTYY